MSYHDANKRTLVLTVLLLKLLPLMLAAQGSFTEVGLHPGAAAQSSATGKMLLHLMPWQGKLYAGYGDYGANTGPIKIYAFHPDSLHFTLEWTANTEAIYNYRALNGQLYAPAIDRKSYGIPGDYTRLDSSGNWADYNFGSNSTHVYDAAALNNSVLFMVGSQDERATVWRSQNNGQSWQKILTDTAISGTSGDFARFYFAGVLEGKLYVQARDYYGSLHPTSRVYDGMAWNDGPSLFPPGSGSLGWHPDQFTGQLVYRSWEPGQSSRLRSFDGVNQAWVDSLYVYDCFVEANNYYALVDSGYGVKNLRRTSDLVNWQNLLSLPTNSRSLAIINDTLYLGTTDSKILRYSLPLSGLSQLHPMIPDPAGFKLYPNPAATEITIGMVSSGRFSVQVFNTLGETVWTAQNQSTVDVSRFSSGLYFLKLTQGAHACTQSFIKE